MEVFKLKTKYSLLILLMLLLIVSACGGKKNTIKTSEEKSKIISQIEDQVSQVNSYELEIEIDNFVTELSTKTKLMENNLFTNVSIIEEPLQGSAKTSENNQSIELLLTEQETYLKKGEEDWEDVTDQPDISVIFKPTYQEVVQVISDLESETDVILEEKNDKYLFSYNGKSESIYKAFEDPFTLSLTGLKPKDMNQEISIVVDTETYLIEQVKNLLTGDKEDQRVTISIDQAYKKFNELEEFTIPQEVIDEAN